MLRPVGIKRIHYTEPLDVVLLFKNENIAQTFNYIFGYFLDEVGVSRSGKLPYYEPIIYFERYDVYHVDYEEMIDRLSELVDNKVKFRGDFALDWSNKNSFFLCIYILENMLGIAKMNSNKIVCKGKDSVNYSPSFARPIVVKYNDLEEFNEEKYMQINAVTFLGNELFNYVNQEIKNALKLHVSLTSFRMVDGVLGRSKCNEFWKTCKHGLHKLS